MDWAVQGETQSRKKNNATGRRYDREFKQNAVELVRAGRTVSRVARDLGVSTWSLGRWVQGRQRGQAQSEPKTLAAGATSSGSYAVCARRTTTCDNRETS